MLPTNNTNMERKKKGQENEPEEFEWR